MAERDGGGAPDRHAGHHFLPRSAEAHHQGHGRRRREGINALRECEHSRRYSRRHGRRVGGDMKFTDGYWGLKEGVKLFAPAEARDVRTNPDSVTVFAPCRVIHHRGDTLNIPQLTFTFSSPREDVVRVHACHFKGGRKRGPAFELNKDEGFLPRIERTPESVSLSSGRLSVRVRAKGEWGVDFFFDGRRLTGSGKGNAGYLIDAAGTP